MPFPPTAVYQGSPVDAFYIVLQGSFQARAVDALHSHDKSSWLYGQQQIMANEEDAEAAFGPVRAELDIGDTFGQSTKLSMAVQ